jgi:hypothetical protein
MPPFGRDATRMCLARAARGRTLEVSTFRTFAVEFSKTVPI